MRPANERRRYDVTSALIGWAHSQNDASCCVLAMQYFHVVSDVVDSHVEIKHLTD